MSAKPRPMTNHEQDDHRRACMTMRAIVSSLRLMRIRDEDVRVALARLENWLTENDDRWTK